VNLSPGARLGHYEVLALIGKGGMGEVYRARDTQLKRDVALKVLPEVFASNSDRLARFQREAEVLAALNHPNIAHIYGLTENTLVMELVEGPKLDDRLKRGPLPPSDALAIAQQIASALDTAHEKEWTPGLYGSLALSPDGGRVAVSRIIDNNSDIWVFDFTGQRSIRLTSNPGTDAGPIWSPNGDRVLFYASRGNSGSQLAVRSANGAGNEETVAKFDRLRVPATDWSSD
jgi:hypothetical protein